MSSRRELLLIALAAMLLTLLVLALAVLPAMAAEPGGARAATGVEDADLAAGAASEAVAAVAPEPSPGLLGSPAALGVGAAAVFGALAIGGYGLLRPNVVGAAGVDLGGGSNARIAVAQRQAAARRTRPAIGDVAGRASAVAERALEKRGWAGRIDIALEQAGIDLRPGELVVLVGAIATGGALVGLLLGGLTTAMFLVFIVVLGTRIVVTNRRDRRRARFADQLGDLLQQLAASLRAGHGLLQAVEGAAREAEAPMRDELRRLTTEVRLGRDFVTSLDAIADRMENEDFRWVVSAIRIHREVGGDLSQVLDRVGDTIRSRMHLHRQVRTLSAEGRMSAWVLAGLPVCLGSFMAIANPVYVEQMLGTGLGLGMLLVAAAMLGVGILWLRRIIRLDV